jgi:hypothetical protein
MYNGITNIPDIDSGLDRSEVRPLPSQESNQTEQSINVAEQSVPSMV